jgi:hypothetical protein
MPSSPPQPAQIRSHGKGGCGAIELVLLSVTLEPPITTELFPLAVLAKPPVTLAARLLAVLSDT